MQLSKGFWRKFCQILIILLPAVLYFSYYPLVRIFSDETMNLELSIPFLWLGIFDVVVLGLMIKGGDWRKLRRRGWILLFPVFASLSILWSSNVLRGVLTVGGLWLVVVAMMGMVALRGLDEDGRVRIWFWRVFYGAGLVVCGWCLIQCVLDLAGVSREVSLMCAGCTYTMFGFPHPNGFAIEPQFMGNLLIAPAFFAGVSFVCIKRKGRGEPEIFDTVSLACGEKYAIWGAGILFVLFAMGLFLTFSRGAIYAFVVAMVILTIWETWRNRQKMVWLLWPMLILAFLLTLNLQGIFAQVSRTDDTYFDGVAKVVNHLSLGLIDIRGGDEAVESEDDGGDVDGDAVEVVEDRVSEVAENEAVFDGYVTESTDTRMKLNEAAVKAWVGDARTVFLGVGIGGAGVAMYEAGLMADAKEIVQNEYASLLLETGVTGVVLVILTGVIALKVKRQQKMTVLVILMAGYGASLLFFSGLPNALHIYLLPVVIWAISVHRETER